MRKTSRSVGASTELAINRHRRVTGEPGRSQGPRGSLSRRNTRSCVTGIDDNPKEGQSISKYDMRNIENIQIHSNTICMINRISEYIQIQGV